MEDNMATEKEKQWAQAAQDYIKMMREALPDEVHHIDKDMMMRMGAKFWEHTYKITDEDEVCYNLLANWLKNNYPEMYLLIGSPDVQLFYTWMARWADFAFPVINLGDKIAAALMTTVASLEIVEEMNPPWDSFLIQIPNDILSTKDPQNPGNQISITVISVLRTRRLKDGKYVWSWRAGNEKSSVQLFQFGLDANALLHFEELDFTKQEFYSVFGTLEDQDQRVSQLINRLIIGVCIAFPEHTRPANKAARTPIKKKGTYIRNERGAPMVRMYQMSAPLEIDCRESVKDYVMQGPRRKGRKEKCDIIPIQRVIPGHYRRPPGGIAKGSGKTVWVHPYWKGPVEAKILVREREVK